MTLDSDNDDDDVDGMLLHDIYNSVDGLKCNMWENVRISGQKSTLN